MPDIQNQKSELGLALVKLPMPPEQPDDQDRVEMDMYARFMRHIRLVPSSREEIRILSAIQFVADMMIYDDSYVAKVLVDLGLRAPRLAFPEHYLEFVDAALLRDGTEIGSANPAMWDLKHHWNEIGEDKFIGSVREVAVIDGLHFSTISV